MLVYGHRGARGIRPENTLAAFEYAISAGAHGIEMDLWVTRDDVPVVSHDPRLPDGTPIRGIGWSELRARAPSVPSLVEVLGMASRGQFLFLIEVKSFPKRPKLSPAPDEFAAIVLAGIDQGTLRARSIVQSFDFRILHAMERLAPEIPRGALFDRGDDFVQSAREAHGSIAVPRFHLVTARRVRTAHDAGIAVYTWTPNRPADWWKLMQAGVDAIITDDPAALVEKIQIRPQMDTDTHR